MKRCFYFIFIIFVLATSIYAQKYRTESMGNLQFSIKDNDITMDLFDFGGNPAWLVESEKEMWLDINPSVSNNWGNYRRKYAPQGTYDLAAGVTGVKPLGTAGTFSASAYYNYEYNRKFYRSMKKYPYAGEAFFYADTTIGDVRYNGPIFSFMHSLNLFDNFYIGAKIDYQIIAGLKKIYSYAQTTYRDVAFTGGIAYKFSENFVLGAKYYLHDEQEKINAEDVNLFSIESYQFRGETFAVPYVSSSVSQKIKKQRNEIALQSFLAPINNIKIGTTFSYAEYDTKILVPKSQIIESPEGYSSFCEYDFKLRAQYIYSKNIITGLDFGYNYIDNWSRNESNNLLVWKWNTSSTYFLLGFSYNFDYLDLVIGSEFGVAINKSDSSKFIDNRFSNIKSKDKIAKIGFEITPITNYKLRGGLEFVNKEHDFIIGGDNVYYYSLTFGIGYAYLDLADINFMLNYKHCTVKDYNDLLRNEIYYKLTARLFTF